MSITSSPPPGVRRRVRLAAAAVGIGLGLPILSAPVVAQAAFIQYALHAPAREVTPKYSAIATVAGGRGYADSGIMRVYVQTMSGTYLVASGYGDAGATVNISHAPYSSAQSRCYWDYTGGTVPGQPTVGLNCWRLQ